MAQIRPGSHFRNMAFNSSRTEFLQNRFVISYRSFTCMETDNLVETSSVNCDDLIKSSQEFATELLLKELPQGFCFHNLIHTQNVVHAAEVLSREEHISKEEKGIVLVSAGFHDTGYTRRYIGHETASVEIATSFLKYHGVAERKIQQVVDCILATRLGATATTVTEHILQDADLFHLGHDDYFSFLSLLRTELETQLGKVMEDRQWLTKNVEFLLRHQYNTTYGRTVLDIKKQHNLELNRKLLDAHSSS